MIPNFMVVGAQKSATTWLFECLHEHPEVFVPELKEVHYYCPADRCRFSRRDKGSDWYQGLFPSDPRYKAQGELTTDYMFYSGVVDDIHCLNPNMKIIFMLRNPIDRAYSAYWMWRRHKADLKPFEELIKTNPEIIERSLYYRQIAPYVEKFGTKNVKIYIYEEMSDNLDRFIEDLYEFIGVDNSFRPKTLGRRVGNTPDLSPVVSYLLYKVISPIINLPVILPVWRYLRRNTSIKEKVLGGTVGASGQANAYPALESKTRQALFDRFEDENNKLFDYLGRRIEAWEQ